MHDMETELKHAGSSAHGHIGGIRSAFFLNLLFAIAEFFGGLYIGSTAVLSDSVHDLSDCISLGVAYFFEKMAHRQSNDVYTYGYGRLSVIGAIITTLTLAAGTAFAIFRAVKVIAQPPEIKTVALLIFAAAGVVINTIPVLKLRGSKKTSEKAVTLHLLEDALGWAAVLVAGIVMQITGFYLLDPILSLLISAFMVWSIYKTIASIIHIIMQSVPEDIDTALIRKELEATGLTVEQLHVWTIDGEQNIASIRAHYTCDCGETNHLQAVVSTIKERFCDMGIANVTVELTEVLPEFKI